MKNEPSHNTDDNTLKQRICEVCPDCLEEPCRPGTNDYCRTCTNFEALIASEKQRADIDGRIDELNKVCNEDNAGFHSPEDGEIIWYKVGAGYYLDRIEDLKKQKEGIK